MELNPYSYEFHEDPFPVYRELRDHTPCYRNPSLGFWALSRYADVLAALHDPATFCSRYGITLEQDNPLPMLLTTDPPAHTDLRRLVSRAFTPRRVADLEPEIRALAQRFLGDLVDAGEGDLVADYAARLPMDVIARMLGVPEHDEEQLRDWTNALLDREEGVPDVTPAGIEAATHLYKYFCDFVADRRAAIAAGRSPDDLTTALCTTGTGDEHLGDDQVVGFLFLLIIAGNETTTKLLANCLLALQRFPIERAKVVDDPRRIPSAVEEILRHEGSTQLMARTLTHDVELHGEHMAEGDKVLLLLGSANRDERVWDHPDEFDIDRVSSVQHVGFGHGIHVCLGAALARLEMRVSLEEILRAMPEYEIDEAGCTRVHSGNVRGWATVPIRFWFAMNDVVEITNLIHEYAFRLDAGDLEGVASLFEHAELGSTRHDRRLRGAEQARTIYDNVIIYDDGTPKTLHQITNVTVHVDDGATASARCCFTVLQVTAQGLHPTLAGEYHDRFERVGGAWRFTERIFDPRLFGDLSAHMKKGPA